MNELILKYAPWSISKVDAGLQCPKMFSLQYIQKAKKTSVRSENKVGIVSHGILELQIKGASFDDAKSKAIEKNPLTSGEEENLAILIPSIDSFLKRFDRFCKEQHVEDVRTEVQWAIDTNFNPVFFFSPDVFFRGVVDLVAKTKTKDLIVIDHKSGSVKPVDKYLPQLNSYAILGLANMELEGFQAAIHFMQADDANQQIQWAPYISKNVIENNLKDWLVRYIQQAVDNLSDLNKASAKKGWPCSWCAYSLACDEYQTLIRGKNEKG